MLRAQRDRKGTRVGMNVPGYDNRQLALNIFGNACWAEHIEEFRMM
jgi:hypothetical protein